MIEFNIIKLIAFGVGCWVVPTVAIVVVLSVCKWISERRDGNTPLVRYDTKSKLDRALGKKD